jgi:hypothetical protein
MRIRQLLIQILQEMHDMHYFFLTAKTISCQSTCTHSEDTQGSFDVICHSSFDRKFSCSAQTANPTCAQSFDLHSLQNGTPSEITLLPLATLSRNVLTFGKSTWLAIRNSLYLVGFWVDILSLWESKTYFLVTLSFLIYASFVELTMLKLISYALDYHV